MKQRSIKVIKAYPSQEPPKVFPLLYLAWKENRAFTQKERKVLPTTSVKKKGNCVYLIVQKILWILILVMLCDRSLPLPMPWLLARKWPRMHRDLECYWQPMAPKLTSCLIWFIRWLTWTLESFPHLERGFYNWLQLCSARKSISNLTLWDPFFWFSNTVEAFNVAFERNAICRD